jgi:hypothetical protein
MKKFADSNSRPFFPRPHLYPAEKENEDSEFEALAQKTINPVSLIRD